MFLGKFTHSSPCIHHIVPFCHLQVVYISNKWVPLAGVQVMIDRGSKCKEMELNNGFWYTSKGDS